MCYCENVKVGEYGNQVALLAPEWSVSKKICIDTCLVPEIKYLWSKGIKTTGSCCGHNTTIPYIGVADEHINTMLELGYDIQFNICRPGDNDTFCPKSITITGKMIKNHIHHLLSETRMDK